MLVSLKSDKTPGNHQSVILISYSNGMVLEFGPEKNAFFRFAPFYVAVPGIAADVLNVAGLAFYMLRHVAMLAHSAFKYEMNKKMFIALLYSYL
ncbi:MAG: hypothetical protein OXE85_12280 [Roseovarius sp.]|nr:hypothetical protein [Roseovarius sp.]